MTSHETTSIYSTNDSIYFLKRLQICTVCMYSHQRVYTRSDTHFPSSGGRGSRRGFVQNIPPLARRSSVELRMKIKFCQTTRETSDRVFIRTPPSECNLRSKHAYFAWLRSKNVRSRHSRPPSRHYERTKGETSRDINASLCFVSLR